MKSKNLDAYVLYHFDAHQSEYLAPADERVAFISGFTGSNGLCLVTRNEESYKDKALMWTDGRYYLQAENQLYNGWEMMKIESDLSDPKWITKHMPTGSRIGVDKSQIPAFIYKDRKKFFESNGMVIEAGENLVDQIWGSERPAMP